jgi:hypothetical protein
MSPRPHPPAANATGLSLSRDAEEGRSIADEIIRQTEAPGAAQLAQAGRIDILRKGKPIPPQDMRGVIRLRLRPAAADSEA